MSEKGTCTFVIYRGVKRGQPCGRNCIVKQGEEPRCFQHKSSNLARKNVKLHPTKNDQIANLEEEAKTSNSQIKSLVLEIETVRAEADSHFSQQENQMGMLIEDLNAAQEKRKEQDIKIKKLEDAVELLELENIRSKLRIDDLQQKLFMVLKKNYSVDNENLRRENEKIRNQFVKALEELKANTEEANTEREKDKIERQKERDKFRQQLIALRKETAACLAKVIDKLSDIKTQTDIFFSNMPKRPTLKLLTAQLAKNTEDIAALQLFTKKQEDMVVLSPPPEEITEPTQSSSCLTQ